MKLVANFLMAAIFTLSIGGIPISSTQSLPINIKSVAWSPNGKYVAAGSSQGISIWDTANHVEVAFLDVVFNPDLAWSPDGNRLAFYRSIIDEYLQTSIIVVEIWDISTLAPLITPIKVLASGNLSWRPDGTQLAIGSILIDTIPGNIMKIVTPNVPIIDTDTGLITQEIPTGDMLSGVDSIVWNPNGNFIAVEFRDSAMLWNLETQAWVLVPEIERIGINGELVWNLEGNRLAFDSGSGIVIWDLETKQAITLEVEGLVTALDWKSEHIAANALTDEAAFVYVWQLTDYQVVQKMEFPNTTIFSISLSPDGQLIAYGSHISPDVPMGYEIRVVHQ